MAPISYGHQWEFARWFAYFSGLNGNVVLAWCLQEQPPGSPATTGSNNWLNIQYTDQGPNSEYFRIARMNPYNAAKASVEWMRRNQPTIVAAHGRSAYDQAAAIANSGWASSHYGGAAKFYAEVRYVEGHGGIPPSPGAGLKGSTNAGTVNVPPHVSTSGDPPDRSPKIHATGQHLGARGTAFAGRVTLMRQLRNRHSPIRL